MTTVADLDPRRDMDLIRARVLHAFEAREDIVPLLRVLADRNPVALADLLVGAKAPEHGAWVEGCAPRRRCPRAVTGTHRTLRAPRIASFRHRDRRARDRRATPSDRELADLDVPKD